MNTAAHAEHQPQVRLYGITNCDQVRAARAWLTQHACGIEFIDLKKTGLDAATLDRWLTHLPWDALLNRRGMTWRQLDPGLRAQINDQLSASELMLAHPLLIKRPVLEVGEKMSVGFSDSLYRSLFPKVTK
ncbi:MAG: arsenate reductase [Betaproteobacteria bacterium]|nr:arsenate reductase [Betaproteobacteria bacterium]